MTAKPEIGSDRYTPGRLSAELGIDNRKMREILTGINPIETRGNRKYYLLRDVIPSASKYIAGPNVVDLNAERGRKLAAEAELVEIELEEKRGSLVSIEDVSDAWSEVIASCKSRLLSMPAKLAPVVAVEDNPSICKQMIQDQIYEALEELSGWVNEYAEEVTDDASYDASGRDAKAASSDDGEPMG